MTMNMRLDVALVQKGLFKSREKAQNAIKNGAVTVDSNVIKKPSLLVSDNSIINVLFETDFFVGRGGIKLKEAIDRFELNLSGLVCLDVGASTGGFTDCMLKNGAKLVFACDVGQGQLADELRHNKNVISLEHTDIRALALAPLDYEIDFLFDFVSVDVSFISLNKILPSVYNLLKSGAHAVCLIKPQFEAGRSFVGKNGIVKDSKIHRMVINNVSDFAQALGFTVLGVIESPIRGGDGNTEFLINLVK